MFVSQKNKKKYHCIASMMTTMMREWKQTEHLRRVKPKGRMSKKIILCQFCFVSVFRGRKKNKILRCYQQMIYRILKQVCHFTGMREEISYSLNIYVCLPHLFLLSNVREKEEFITFPFALLYFSSYSSCSLLSRKLNEIYMKWIFIGLLVWMRGVRSAFLNDEIQFAGYQNNDRWLETL